MFVSNFSVTHQNSYTTFSADVDFEKQSITQFFKNPYNLFKKHRKNIWFTIPTVYVQDDTWTDAFYIFSLVIALAAGERLIFNAPVSNEVLKKTAAIEKMFRYEHSKRIIDIQTKPGRQKRKKNTDTAQFFTLGVDSFYTLLCFKPNQKRALLYVDGYDIPLTKTTFIGTVHKNIDAVAHTLQTNAVYISTNVRELSDPVINWPQFHVAGLVSVGMLLNFGTVYINGESFDWPDWGLRYGIDELFSMKSMQFPLIGHNITRDVKIKKIMKSSHYHFFLRNVRVCWKNILENTVPYNCSVCQKCIRTYLTFLALGIKNTPTFKKPSLQNIRSLEIVGHVRNEWTILYGMLKKKRNTDPKLLRALADVLLKPTRV